MNNMATEEPENDEDVISSAIENMAFFLFSILSDCYPEIATSEFEDVFNKEFRIDILSFIKNYRKSAGNRMAMSGKDLAQIYSNQRFYEKLSRALDQCKKDKTALTAMNQVKAFQF